MALDNLVDGMTGLQMANVIKANFDKVLDAESAENKAENAGKSIKTDYDATRYIELQLADGTPVKMKMDVFCQAIAPVVAELIGTATTQKKGLFPSNRVCVYGTIGQGVTWAKITIPFTTAGNGMALALNWFSTANNTSTAIANIIRWNAVAVKTTLSFGEIVFVLKYEVINNQIILYVKTETSYGILSATPISIVGNAAILVEPYSGTIPDTAKDVNVVTIS